MRARDQSSIFSIGWKFRPDYGLLLELHALTLVAHSYVFLFIYMQHVQDMLLFLVVVVNSDRFGVTHSYSSRSFLCALV